MTHLYRCTTLLLGEIYSANEDETASLRKTLPGEIVLIGGLFSSMYLTWTMTCAYATKYLDQSVWKVSCISRAGWYSGKFNAVKLCQSSSISGPSDTLKPILEKISIIWFYQWNRVTGSDDYRFRRTRQITVKPLLSSLFSKVSWMLLTFLPQRILTN
jgi:hypothetical protein